MSDKGTTTMPEFFTRANPPIASYDYIDWVGGAGYKRFYGVYAAETTLVYFLSTQKMDSSSGWGGTNYYGWWTRSNVGAELNINFDLTFNVPAIIVAANAYLNVTWGVEANDALGRVVATLSRVRGAVVTQIGTGTTCSRNISVASIYRDAVRLACSTTKLAVGDVLRLNILVTGDKGGSDRYRLWHDPTSSKTETEHGGTYARTVGTDLTIDVPFKIDL